MSQACLTREVYLFSFSSGGQRGGSGDGGDDGDGGDGNDDRDGGGGGGDSVGDGEDVVMME